ncbi:MAG: hypothetical protein HY033_12275 [Ignavibacteriae bacterium]|nr:hypothetical protein [Ignavibacteria bacterium]MBI3365668.1 hypothetical protein [Ignavibacteriota bacterium]
MRKAEELFHRIAAELSDAREGKMFGALCMKAPNGKAAAIFWKDSVMFKLAGRAKQEALNLDSAQIGVHLYDSHRPMKGWVQIPFKHSAKWKRYAKSAIENVKGK